MLVGELGINPTGRCATRTKRSSGRTRHLTVDRCADRRALPAGLRREADQETKFAGRPEREYGVWSS